MPSTPPCTATLPQVPAGCRPAPSAPGSGPTYAVGRAFRSLCCGEPTDKSSSRAACSRPDRPGRGGIAAHLPVCLPVGVFAAPSATGSGLAPARPTARTLRLSPSGSPNMVRARYTSRGSGSPPPCPWPTSLFSRGEECPSSDLPRETGKGSGLFPAVSGLFPAVRSTSPGVQVAPDQGPSSSCPVRHRSRLPRNPSGRGTVPGGTCSAAGRRPSQARRASLPGEDSNLPTPVSDSETDASASRGSRTDLCDQGVLPAVRVRTAVPIDAPRCGIEPRASLRAESEAPATRCTARSRNGGAGWKPTPDGCTAAVGFRP
jgi:hypothetical protein